VAGEAGDAMAFDPAPVGEELKTDEIGVAGKGRGAGIGRVAVASGAEGENLPDVLPGCGEKRYEFVGRGAQIADASVGGQRADMKKNAGGTLKIHGLIIPCLAGVRFGWSPVVQSAKGLMAKVGGPDRFLRFCGLAVKASRHWQRWSEPEPEPL